MEPRYARAEDLVQDVGHWLALSGVPAEEAEYLKSASMGAREFVSVVEPDLLLEGAEHLALDGGEILVVWTPGHSPGHCCFYCPRRQLLFSGDHLLPTISPNIGLHPQSSADPLDDYLQALDRVAALPVRTVLPAHGDPFADHKARAAQIRQHHEARKDALLALASEPKSGWDLALSLFHDAMGRNVFQKRLALQETLAHCQSLAQEGRLRKLATARAVRWVRA
jgi:glyoxylase-like metal-dependent hydrolase (beta-lactamase superfamily II)